ncbi:MAG: IS1634 family transposase [Anaerolineae bacterium]
MSEVTVQTERVNDIPLLLKQQQTMGIAALIDGIVPRHGNRRGLSLGWMITGWLCYILSERDHRLSFVEEWASGQLETLNKLLPGQVTAPDFADDRLGEALRLLSQDAVWFELENQLSQRLVRVYQLPQETARVDTTTVSLYHDQETSELFARGHSKDHRPDLAQVKVVFVTLDPLALPVVTMVLPGNRADDGVYIPAITTAQENLSTSGLLYVGDSKMEALATRAHIAQSGDYYLLPLSQKGSQGQSRNAAVAQVLADDVPLEAVYDTDDAAGAEARLLAQGWETERQQTFQVEDRAFQWTERQLLIYSPALAKSGYRGLEQRLQSATDKLRRLTPEPGRGRRQYQELPPLQEAVAAILTRHRVADFLEVTYARQVQERHVRRYGDRPARVETAVRYQLHITRNEAAIQAAYRQMGWRWYVTNAPAARLSLAQAVRVYRGGVATIERLFSRLKGRPLGLRPLFVRRDDHLVGLVRLLSLALRILTLIEFQVRQALQSQPETLSGLYPGQPTRTTDRPTTERLLRAFKGITLSIIDLPGQHIRHVTPLSSLQVRILQLLRFSDSIYTELAQPPPIPP